MKERERAANGDRGAASLARRRLLPARRRRNVKAAFRSRPLSIPFAILVICTLPAANACAYIDAGTGSLLIQLAMGTVLAGLLTVRLWWARLKSWITRAARRRGKDNGDG